MGLASQLTEDREAVLPRQADVEKEQVEDTGAGKPQGLVP